jgi:UDP-N-acetylmuramoyl-L-alanyl-D-glutamate--2,6-diaminopimelate ligase
LTCDSRRVAPGTLFFALHGATVDGHSFIPATVSSGAAAVVLEDSSSAPEGLPWIQVPDGREAMALMAAEFYGNPTLGLPLVGITGTNGKTTTTYLIEAILAAAEMPAAVLGTISYRFGATQIEASHTTPESTELQAAFRQLADAGARAFVMEVSSHALEQKRVDGCHFDVAVFSNLTRDHLDYHKTMESYLESKARLFSELLHPTADKPRRCAAVNMDDPYGEDIAARSAGQVITYGIKYEGDVRAIDVVSSVDGLYGTLVTPRGSVTFSSRLLGRFNLSNILAAASAGIALDLPLTAIKAGIEGHATVPGRMERVANTRGVTLLVDYAHTGDALENVLSTLRELATGRIITVFGCGGDRDPGKRPIMGSTAAQMSDLAIATSDNPRTEDPQAILSQVKAGISPLGIREYGQEELSGGFAEKGFIMLENRRDAIRLAVRLARPGDIILLAGKGHEDYQIIGRTKHHFDDREEAARAFAETNS